MIENEKNDKLNCTVEAPLTGLDGGDFGDPLMTFGGGDLVGSVRDALGPVATARTTLERLRAPYLVENEGFFEGKAREGMVRRRGSIPQLKTSCDAASMAESEAF